MRLVIMRRGCTLMRLCQKLTPPRSVLQFQTVTFPGLERMKSRTSLEALQEPNTCQKATTRAPVQPSWSPTSVAVMVCLVMVLLMSVSSMPSINATSVMATKHLKFAMTLVSPATGAPTTASRSPMATSASDGVQPVLPNAVMATLKVLSTPLLENLSMN